MTIQQTVRDILASSSRQIGGVFRSKASIQEKRESLLDRVRSGQLAEEILNSAGWEELLEPCLINIRDKARFDLENDHSPKPKDVGRYYPMGVIHVIREVLGDPKTKSMFEKTIEKAQTARQELSFLQKEEKEQDNAR